MPRVWLGFGANLGDVRATLARAVDALSSEGAPVVDRAPLYRSRPVGPPGQPDYLNTALEVDTELGPEALLAALKRIERELGRVPSERWGPRAIDLDILLYGEARLDTPELTIPHRELTKRRFVLAPLAARIPERAVPGTGRTVSELLASLGGDPSEVELAP